MSEPIPKIMIRRKVREVIAMRAGFGKTEDFVIESVNSLCGGGVPLRDVREAIAWNEKEAYIRSHRDEEYDEVLWFITNQGLAKQAIQ